MRKAKLQKVLRAVQAEVDAGITSFAKGGNLPGSLASEGYNGGYRDALMDVMLAQDDIWPNQRPHWWEKVKGEFPS
jgi:hypothetical protein